MKINATFQGKQLAMEEEPCEVRKVISLPDKEYAFFKKHLMPDHFRRRLSKRERYTEDRSYRSGFHPDLGGRFQ